MKVLHINVSAINDKFYLGFFELLKNRNIVQTVFVPFSNKEYGMEEQKDTILNYESKSINIQLLPIKNKQDRIFYFRKIGKYEKYLLKRLTISDYELLHAHSLYSDGGVAYKIYKDFGVPYIVAVRSTDTEIFMKYFKWLNKFAKHILENAAKIIFISPDLKNKTIESLYKGERRKISWMDKCEIIPNGVNDFWLENKYECKELRNKNAVNILQVSRLNKGKNVDKSVLAIKELRDKGIDANFYVAGSGTEESNIKKLIKKLNLEKYVHLLGFVSNKNDLLNLYRKCDIFLMPSVGETFGISYIEAFTQGLPVIGVKGTGIGGYFEDGKIGFFVNTPTPIEIADSIEKIMKNYESLSRDAIGLIEKFNWKNIIDIYMDLYKKTAGTR